MKSALSAARLSGLLLCNLLALSAPIQALQSFDAEYSLSLGILEFARVRVSLQLEASGNYRYLAHTTPVGVTAVFHSDEITERSSGRIERQEVIPERYHYQHVNSDSPRLADLSFDWEKMRVTNAIAASHWYMDIKPGTQDKFSQQLQLMLRIADDVQPVEFPVADGGRTKTYRFEPAGSEPVRTESGHYRALKVVRRKDRRPSQASLWLAPELDYLPVRVERIEEEGRFVMELQSIRLAGQPLLSDD